MSLLKRVFAKSANTPKTSWQEEAMPIPPAEPSLKDRLVDISRVAIPPAAISIHPVRNGYLVVSNLTLFGLETYTEPDLVEVGKRMAALEARLNMEMQRREEKMREYQIQMASQVVTGQAMSYPFQSAVGRPDQSGYGSGGGGGGPGGLIQAGGGKNWTP